MIRKEDLTPREQLDEYLKCLPNSANQLKWNNNLPGSDILNYKDIGILLTEQLEPQFYLNLGAVSHFDAQDAMLLGIPDGYAGDFLTVLTLVPSVNHSPGSIIQFAYGPGTTYTRFDNGLDSWNAWTAMSGGSVTPNPNTGIRTVNGRSPDQSGNVETDFRVIDVIRADVPWTEYAEGKTEFLTEFKISEYPRSRNSSVPGLELLPDGEIIVRTVTDPHKTVCYQTVDTVVDGIFQGSFARLGNSDGTWGPLTAKEHNKGDKGDKGDPGERGPAGATGATGAAGPKGDTGPAGSIGPQGPQGPIGQTGLSGQTGPRGPQGEKGDMGDGFTITAIYKTVAEMHADIGNPEIPVGAFVIISSDNPDTDPDNSKVFVKTTTEYRFQSVLRGLKGEKGDRGLQGVQGAQGIPGTTGVDGAKGDKGDVGATGATGPKGDKGDTGLEGPTGPPGTVINDSILPTTPPTNFQRGLTITSPRAHQNDEVYAAWRDWVIATSGANINYGSPFYVRIETTRSDYPITTQVIKIIVPSSGVKGYSEVMQITRMALTETGAFNTPGIQMNTMRGSGSPQGTVSALIGNSYYDYTNKVMYTKTDEGPNDPQTNGWVVNGGGGGGGTPGPQGPKGDTGATGPAGPKGDTGATGTIGATGPKGDKGDPGDPLQIVDNLFSEDEEKALSARQGNILAQMIYGVEDELGEHIPKIASTTELGHVKIDGTSVKMHENNQIYVDVGDLPIPIQMNSEYIMSDSPTTYPVGHVISMIGPDDIGFADLVTEYGLEYDVELTSLTTRFIVQTVKNDKNMTHQTAQAVSSNRGSVLGTMYRFSQSSIYGFSSWYAQTQVLTGRGAPGDQGRGEGMSGNLYVNSITGRVHAKAGYDKTVGYTNWRLVGPAVVNNAFEPEEDDDEHVYSAYTVERMFEGAKNNLKNNVKLNRIWESDPIPANATTWTVDFSDEPDLTDLNNYDFEIYDDGVLIFGNPITHVVNNANKTVTFTPERPMPRAFTLTCVGRGMEYR